ncbi:hypothetical protein GJA_341 [Janthinobacterium agaricidamnosum NBRC 102515 = DSM 9628]|uniref:Uncharacterized protein n=1 Tax=Janthinobacterium agaricidamnosum NBRC 102515 = DSM 9628 TaxID=1349767 RepID=W0V156_9BURK|nr:hypothetical protein GJA_341 [Janthinobacterium agaricidamnosum NBRC 102515 = DSM 9628]
MVVDVDAVSAHSGWRLLPDGLSNVILVCPHDNAKYPRFRAWIVIFPYI